ncbi:prolyl oligopeptidase family serine peptidase [Shewanella sedimentimangrovi]|uniref:S9 family peptidase n=1 Tax=Shewanella sedimentimangrovi TaxID=2814293 RepID=A0ABX7R4Z5_9GAMM|nr:prolyl oligopeptidase family serine peptidase [Shewanella sedimentimangrovi]QSX38922.1 S9 family peptidase [Shewanella sedimentimangrovi]
MKHTLLLLSLLAASQSLKAEEDAFLWLEDVEGAKPMSWVKSHNQRSAEEIKAYPGFDTLVSNSLAILNDKARIPYAFRINGQLYNFWKDDEHPRGILRTTSREEYAKDSPNWHTVLDIDALGRDEGVNWVYKGFNCQYPKNERCFVSLSRGGADAVEVREFNLTAGKFVSENQYWVPEAKSDLTWLDENKVFIGTDFGPGSMTDSGYPKQVKLWQRGTPLKDAKLVFSGEQASVAVGAQVLYDGIKPLALISEFPTFFTSRHQVYQDGKLAALNVPEDATIAGYYQGKLFLELKSELKQGKEAFPQGAVVYADVDSLVSATPHFALLVSPTPTASINQVSFTRAGIFVNWLDNVKNRLERLRMDANGQWQVSAVDFPSNGSLTLTDPRQDSDSFFVDYTSFLEPPSLYEVDGASLKFNKLKAMPEGFDGSKFVTEQHFATSKDGTRVPYFVVMAKETKLNGANPTLLYGYGGFEVSLRPKYSATIGKNWLEQGGVYVLANIRGGGEYGPAWHQAALKQNRHKAYEDFEAIAEDLIARKITSSRHLGIQGGSNGGLLMGAAFTRRPDLYNAVVCQVPLLDMKRFNQLLAGASWMGEYGNPDVAEQWDYIKGYSPYHNLDKNKRYPKVFFTTSTRDDRVHPGHARKMVAKMESMGIDVLYYENIEGGHAGAADNHQAAELNSLAFAYLLTQLK